MTAPLLEVDNLHLEIPVRGRLRTVIHDSTFSIGRSQSLGLVGESGSGKSMTARTVMRLLMPGAAPSGSVAFDGEDVLAMKPGRLRRYRGSQVSMIYQDPRVHINPVRTIGDFLLEASTAQGVPRQETHKQAVDLLAQVGITDGGRRMKQYPHQLSGGLLQRVMIACALLTDPELILADEPTTALDVTTQEEVMAILDAQRRSRQLAMLFITHDLDLAAAVTDQMAVMYAGMIVEVGPSETLHLEAKHPYTVGLMRSRPVIGRRSRIQTIPGRPVSAFETGPGCVFAARCPYRIDRCIVERPVLHTVGGRAVACHRAEELQGKISFPEVAHS